MGEFFETIHVQNKVARHLLYHQRRYEKTVRDFGGVVHNLADVIMPKENTLCRAKLVYTPKEILTCTFSPYTPRKINAIKIVEADLHYDYKYLNREQIDAVFAKKSGCDEVLFCSNGYIQDTSIANVAFYNGKVWLSPKKPLLPGTTRQRYIEAKKLFLKDIHVDELPGFSHIALLNAMVDFAIMSIENTTKDIIVVK